MDLLACFTEDFPLEAKRADDVKVIQRKLTQTWGKKREGVFLHTCNMPPNILYFKDKRISHNFILEGYVNVSCFISSFFIKPGLVYPEFK